MIKKLVVLSESTNVMADVTKFTLILSFDPEKADLIIKEAGDRLSELESKELIEDITTTENEATMEVVFFSRNASVSGNSLKNSFTGIHHSVDARIFSEKLNDGELDNENDPAPTDQDIETMPDNKIKNRIKPLNLNGHQPINESNLNIAFKGDDEVTKELAFHTAGTIGSDDKLMIKALGNLLIYHNGRGKSMKLIKEAMLEKELTVNGDEKDAKKVVNEKLKVVRELLK